ncbi:MAG: thiamine-phosphate kinase [Desulfocapsaceae bacterium]
MSRQNWSELDIIEHLANLDGTSQTADLIHSIGDDCAIFATDRDHHWLTTTDMLVENIHFNLAWHPPELLGRKSIAVNLSDIAAMGGEPRFALLSIGLPDYLELDWIKSWSAGMLQMLREHDCRLIGGDTVRGPLLVINVTILGSVEPGGALLRAGARVGENIYVSGRLGSAGAGLAICSNPATFAGLDQQILQPFVDHHLNPAPAVALGRLLGRSRMIGAMQDISDGLATDLAHICKQSGVGAEVEADLLPALDGLNFVADRLALDPLKMITGSGEDYHLLFTVRSGMDEALGELLEKSGQEKIFRIGRITEKPGVFLHTAQGDTDISFQGFEHRSGADQA